MISISLLIVLLVVFQLKHLLADYFLQDRYMIGKFKEHGWFKPLLSHVIVHGTMTFIICCFAAPDLAIPAAILDMFFHFAMYRIKASSKLLGRFKPVSKERMEEIMSYYNLFDKERVDRLVKPELKSNKWFWYSLGIDQAFHHLTHYIIIIAILLNNS